MQIKKFILKKTEKLTKLFKLKSLKYSFPQNNHKPINNLHKKEAS